MYYKMTPNRKLSTESQDYSEACNDCGEGRRSGRLPYLRTPTAAAGPAAPSALLLCSPLSAGAANVSERERAPPPTECPRPLATAVPLFCHSSGRVSPPIHSIASRSSRRRGKRERESERAACLRSSDIGHETSARRNLSRSEDDELFCGVLIESVPSSHPPARPRTWRRPQRRERRRS